MSHVEFTTLVPPIEYADRNWRQSFRQSCEKIRAQILNERREGRMLPYYTADGVHYPPTMDPDEIDDVARASARRFIEAAIRKHEGRLIRQKVKRRKNEAL